MDVVVDIIRPSCTIAQMQGAHGVCALRALVTPRACARGKVIGCVVVVVIVVVVVVVVVHKKSPDLGI